MGKRRRRMGGVIEADDVDEVGVGREESRREREAL